MGFPLTLMSYQSFRWKGSCAFFLRPFFPLDRRLFFPTAMIATCGVLQGRSDVSCVDGSGKELLFWGVRKFASGIGVRAKCREFDRVEISCCFKSLTSRYLLPFLLPWWQVFSSRQQLSQSNSKQLSQMDSLWDLYHGRLLRRLS